MKGSLVCWLLAGLVVFAAASGLAQQPPTTLPAVAHLQQYSVLGALLTGEYDGVWQVNRLRQQADFGLGAAHQLAGEVVVLDGVFYVADANGQVRMLAGEQRLPFAVLTLFQPQQTSELHAVSDAEALYRSVTQLADSADSPLAIQVDGHFTSVRLRSEHRQDKPYAPLAEVMAKDEVRYTAQDIEGTLVGFYTPSYLSDVSIPGYHFHFLSADKRLGGHVLGVQISQALLRVARLSGFQLFLPGQPEG